VQFETFEDFVLAVRLGRVVRGDLVYVSPELYRALPVDERRWLWQQALRLRLRLVTDLVVRPPVSVKRPAGGE
jgi:hypothetical protein